MPIVRLDHSSDVEFRKWSKDGEAQAEVDASAAKVGTRKLASRTSLDGLHNITFAGCRAHDLDSTLDEHVPHSICQYIQELDHQFAADWDLLASIDQTHGPR